MQLTRRQLLTTAGSAALMSACGRQRPGRAESDAPTPIPDSSAPSSVAPSAVTSSAPASPAISPTTTQSPAVTAAFLAKLSAMLSNPLVMPSGKRYFDAAKLYNPRFDATSKPAAIAECHTPVDVATCVRQAADARVPLRLRSGGHSYGGWSSGAGLLVDVGPLASVTVDTAAGLARIGAGARLGQVYAALAAKGVALAAGSCPTVGIAGLTLGGGVGALSRAYGLTCDALTSVQIVTADGRLREVNATTDSDLFWALRGGGGGSFGAVTAFTMAVRPAPEVHTYYLRWPVEQVHEVLDAWQRWIAAADPRLWSTCKLLADPPTQTQSLTVSGTWIGPASALTGQLTPLHAAIGSAPSAQSASTLSYAQAMLFEAGCLGQSAAQCQAIALTPAKRLPFAATSAILTTALPEAGIDAAAAAVRTGLNLGSLVEGGLSLDALGAQVAAVPPSGTAFVHRYALATVQYTATWQSMATASTRFDQYVGALRAALLPWTGASAYVNYADPAIADYGAAYWGSNYPRLRAAKRRYDPTDVFSFAQAVAV